MENNDFTAKISDETDKIVNKYLDEGFVNKFTNMQIVQIFFKNGLFLTINSWVEKNIKILSQVIGWISIIMSIILIFSPLNLLLLLGFISLPLFIYTLINAIGGIVIAIIIFINGIGLVKMKKWLGFSTILLFIVSNGINILSQIFSFTLPFGGYNYQYGKTFFGILLGLIISLFISFTFTCLILKNKEKFDK